MEKERNYDNDGLDPSEEYFRKKKIMMRIPISLQKNQNHLITRSIDKCKTLNTRCREIKNSMISL